MSRIQFWVDEWNDRLIILDIDTNQKIEIHQKRQIDQFLFLYGMQLEQVQGVIEAEDHLCLFQK